MISPFHHDIGQVFTADGALVCSADTTLCEAVPTSLDDFCFLQSVPNTSFWPAQVKEVVNQDGADLQPAASVQRLAKMLQDATSKMQELNEDFLHKVSFTESSQSEANDS